MNRLVFVYGALRKGALHHWRMKECTYVGDAAICGTLVKVDWYPGLVLSGEGWVKGEVYEVGPKVLAELDEFEGVGTESERDGEYHCIEATVTLTDGSERSCLIYEWLKGISNYEIVTNGDWLTVEA